MPWWGVPLRIVAGRRQVSTQMAGDMARETRSGRMADYAFAVHRAAGRLNAVEASNLRQSGALPDWFFAAVEEERKADRRRSRH
jgi:nicotinamide mononucleotide (NMN) deamidase PncC